MTHHRRTASIAFVALAALAIGTNTFAQEGGEGGGSAEPLPPGVPVVADSEPLVESDVTEDIDTGGAEYDPTILTKFIAGRGFEVNNGTGIEEDAVAFTGQTCVRADAAAGGAITVLFAAVELPDGARIKQIAFFGADTDPAENIVIQLYRSNFNIPTVVGPPTRTDQLIDGFTTAGVNGPAAINGADNLEEVAGSFRTSLLTGTNHRFHNVRVQFTNASAANHVLCGIEVRYQVPAGSTSAGTLFTPIEPTRVYDSRGTDGLLAPNTSRVISVKDAKEQDGTVITPDIVPDGATAIAYNITIANATGPNFVSVTPGDAASFTASAINFNGTADIANAGTVEIDAEREITVWGGDQPGSMQIIIDVTGYYTTLTQTFPNMGN